MSKALSVSVSLTGEQVSELETIAEDKGVSFSKVVQDAVDQYRGLEA